MEVNKYDRRVDFAIDGISFDHKATVFPKGYRRPLQQAMAHPRDLIQWLNQNQSREQRMHYRNRLFVVLYAQDGVHWKLKAEIRWLQGLIENYLLAFSVEVASACVGGWELCPVGHPLDHSVI